MKPKTPSHSSWERNIDPQTQAEVEAGVDSDLLAVDEVGVWRHLNRGVYVISTVEFDEHDEEAPPLYHVSVSRPGGRPTDGDLSFVRRGFDIEKADEVQSTTGVRHLFLRVEQN